MVSVGSLSLHPRDAHHGHLKSLHAFEAHHCLGTEKAYSPLPPQSLLTRDRFNSALEAHESTLHPPSVPTMCSSHRVALANKVNGSSPILQVWPISWLDRKFFIILNGPTLISVGRLFERKRGTHLLASHGRFIIRTAHQLPS